MTLARNSTAHDDVLNKRTFDQVYIDGGWRPSNGTELIDVHNPATEEVVARVVNGTPEDVDLAVQAAVRAFPAWSTSSLDDRSEALQRIAEALRARREEIAELVTRDVGTPISESQPQQADSVVRTFERAAQLVYEIPREEAMGSTLVIREPIGAVGCITPWNYPLFQVAIKIGPALAAGCTTVLKPSEVAPLTSYLLADVIHDAGLPPGVFNLVSGRGIPVGEAIARHPGLDMISFTGSTRAGGRVAELAGASIKKVHLELGGKSAAVILRGADLEKAVRHTFMRCYVNSGQSCAALTRLLVPHDLLAETEVIVKRVADEYKVGDPLDRTTRIGPMVSDAQRKRVVDYIESGIKERARLLRGGPDRPKGLPKGFFVEPTVFSDVSPTMTIAREEIFGPVLSILPYRSEEEAIAVANGTDYALSGAVWAPQQETAIQFARHLRSGNVLLNGAMVDPDAPFGGFKRSGFGRERGRYGVEEFMTTKALLQIPQPS